LIVGRFSENCFKVPWSFQYDVTKKACARWVDVVVLFDVHDI
jgi:hypothetical protein